MKDPEQYFCPLTQQPCNDMCAWADVRYDVELDENEMPTSVERDVYCAIGVIAGWCLEQSEGIDDYIE